MNNELQNYLKRALGFPQEIHLESSSRCQAQCTICPRGGMERYQGEMSRDLFDKAIHECVGKELEYIHYHLNGEPLLMDIDELVSRINYTREAFHKTETYHVSYVYDAQKKRTVEKPRLCFFTNGALLDKERVDKLLESELDIIVISIDGGNKEDYEKIRVGLNWERLVENVTYLVDRRNATGSKLWIQTAIIPQMANKGSLGKYFRLFRDEIGVDDCGGSGVQNIGGLIDSENMIIKEDQYMDGDINAPCWRVFLDLSVCADGKAVVCCQCVRADLVIGDLNTQSIKEIWNGEAMTDIRENFITGRKAEIPFCAECDYMRSFCAPPWWNTKEIKEAYYKVKDENNVYAESTN